MHTLYEKVNRIKGRICPAYMQLLRLTTELKCVQIPKRYSVTYSSQYAQIKMISRGVIYKEHE